MRQEGTSAASKALVKLAMSNADVTDSQLVAWKFLHVRRGACGHDVLQGTVTCVGNKKLPQLPRARGAQ